MPDDLCVHCGQPNPAGAAYCAGCGQPMAQGQAWGQAPAWDQAMGSHAGVAQGQGGVAPMAAPAAVPTAAPQVAPQAVPPVAQMPVTQQYPTQPYSAGGYPAESYAAAPQYSGEPAGGYQAPSFAQQSGMPMAPPAPVAPAASTYVPAELSRRLLAIIIDAVPPFVLGMLAVILNVIFVGMDLPTVGLLLSGLIYLAMLGYVVWAWSLQATTGQSFGKRRIGLRVVLADTMQAPGYGKVFVRYALWAISTWIGWVIGAVQVSGDVQGRRAWWDNVVGVGVLDLKAGLDPFDAQGAGQGAVQHVEPYSHEFGQEFGQAQSYSQQATAPAAFEEPQQFSAAAVEQAPISSVPIQSVPGIVSPQPQASAPVPEPSPAPTPTPMPMPTPSSAPAPMPEPAPVPAPTPIPAPAPVSQWQSSPAQAPSAQAPVAQTPLAPTPSAPIVPADDIESTIASFSSGSAAPAVPSYTLTVDTGAVFVVSGAAIIGRDPEAAPGEPSQEALKVNDPGRSVSKTHASIGVDGTGLWVMDRGSTNGTRIIFAGGEIQRLNPMEPIYVPADGSFAIGDRTVSVTPSGAL